MRTTFNLSIYCCILLISCSRTENKETSPFIQHWNQLIIENRGQRITIDKNEDYGVRDTCDFKLKKINEDHYIYEPVNRGYECFKINEQQKDSIFNCIYDIISNPVYTEQYATCFAGNISIGFKYGNTTLICEYTSVGEWKTISPQTEILYSLLNKITKTVDD